MNQKILITAALPYANGAIHFGHLAGAYLPADCYARFMRFTGNQVLFISGSDEYGIAVSLSAEQAGISPQAHVDAYHEINKQLFAKMNISFDHYSRTTWPGHVETSCQYFHDLLENGFIEPRETDQLYSVEDALFLADRYVVGTCPHCGFEAARGDECTKCGASYEATDLKNPRSRLTQRPLSLKKTTNWFLRLDLFRDKLSEWLKTKTWKTNVVNFVAAHIADLRPRAITRDTSWGIPVPIEAAKGKVLYVWFEAPIGYISATKEWAQLQGDADKWKQYWLDQDTKLVQFVGKDNIPFHAMIFPSMTMGQTVPYKLVDDLVANEFLNLHGHKFSKSEGWYIDLEDSLRRYTTDQLRYAILANAPESQDADFTWHDFQQKVNGDLVGKFGNFIHRTLVFVHKQLSGKIPNILASEDVDQQFMQNMDEILPNIYECFSQYRIRRACQLLMELAQVGNVYFDMKKPWKDAKNEDTRARMETTLFYCLECIRRLAVASYVLLPDTAEQVWALLGITKPLAQLTWQQALVSSLGNLPEPKPLFSKIEDEQVTDELARLPDRNKFVC